MLLHGLLHPLPELVVGLCRARDADNRKVLGQQATVRERVERREELPLRQVAGRTEDDEDAVVRCAPDLQPFEQRIFLRDRHGYRGSGPAFARSTALTAWPPNWFRRAAATLAENLMSSRDAKRAKSDAAMTGAGTFSLIASLIVQRPSPESSTYGAMSSSFAPCVSNAACRSSSSHERTTEPLRQMPEISCASRSNSECSMISKPSAYDCMRPYSIPLCTIFTKWPAPDGPTCAYPSSGASALKIGSSRPTGSSSPPTMRQKPTSSPQTPPDTPASTKWIPRCFASTYRRFESRKIEVPPSTIVSPSSAISSSSWKVCSVISPAGIIIQKARGASSCSLSSPSESAVRAPTLGSYVWMSWPCSRRRSVIPDPMRPSPIIPSCTRDPPV